MFRRGECVVFPADHRAAVLSTIDIGGQRIYGEGRLRHGQSAEKNRIVRPFFCSYAHRIRLLCTGDYGDEDSVERTGSKADHSSCAVYVVQREAADLRYVYSGVFSEVRGFSHDQPVYHGNSDRHFMRISSEEDHQTLLEYLLIDFLYYHLR